MEAVTKLIRELAELLKTSLREVVIIALCYIVYVQHGDNKALQVQMRLDKEKDSQDKLNIFREVMNKTDKVMDKTNQVMDKADTIITNKGYGQ